MQNKTKQPAPFNREGHTTSLLLSVEEARDMFVEGGSTLRLDLAVITVTPQGAPRNVWGLDEVLGGLMMGCLKVKGIGFSHKSEGSTEIPEARVTRALDAYGFRVEYSQPYSVNLKEAEGMVKTLRTIERRLDAASERDGRAKDFPTYVRRAAKALGIAQITFPTEPNGSGSYDRGSYRTLPLEAGLYHLEMVVDAWKRGEVIPGVVHHSR